jgi:2-oxoglutarate/2-oxoacid ferredoxin oxidoreductase subunit beta
MSRASQDYKSAVKPIWCPGCGNYGAMKALTQAFLDLDIAPESIALVSGIGCSGRMSHFFNTYSLHGTHGRAVPTALGVKAARPDLTVLAVGGDGDGLSIGGGHISHAARKNTDITYLLLDNRIYGLTKGQASPTTDFGHKTKTSPFGVDEPPMDALPAFIVYDATFVARSSTVHVAELTDLLKAAILHKGFSILHILTPCVTYPVFDARTLKAALQPLPEVHDRKDKMAAIVRGYSTNPVFTGIFFQTEKPTLEERLERQAQSFASERSGDELDMLRKVLYDFS